MHMIVHVDLSFQSCGYGTEPTVPSLSPGSHMPRICWMAECSPNFLYRTEDGGRGGAGGSGSSPWPTIGMLPHVFKLWVRG